MTTFTLKNKIAALLCAISFLNLSFFALADEMKNADSKQNRIEIKDFAFNPQTLTVKSWLHFGENIGYSYIRNQGLGNTNSVFGGPLGSAINLDPLTPVVITDPNVLNSAPYNNQPVEFNSKGQPYAISNYVGQEETNPLAYEKTQQSYNWSHNFISN